MRLILLLLLTTALAGAQQASPAMPVRTSPWFGAHAIDFVTVTPPPPASGSKLDRQDMNEVLLAQRTRTVAQVQQAQADDTEEDMFIFASTLGPRFNAAELPLTAAFSQHLRDASAVINPPLKIRFGRPRPFVASTRVHPVCEKTSSNSFPSGHSMVGTLEALALTEIVPEQSPAILHRLDEYTHNRVVCGVHYPSDIAASRIIASVLFGLIAASPVFQGELAAAKAEVRTHLSLSARSIERAMTTGTLNASAVSLAVPAAVRGEGVHVRTEILRDTLLHPVNVLRWLSVALLALGSIHSVAQSKPQAATSSTFPVVMMSDVHFDPLHDPARVALLAKAPIAEWAAILGKPESPKQAADFAAVQETCKAKDGVDTPYALFRGSLSAAREHAGDAAFVTVSGDLLVHDLDCRYRASMGLPPSAADDQSVSADFAEKTTVFVMQQIEATFPHIPVYLALGNNDSRCNHNRLDLNDRYLKASVSAVIDGLRGVSASDKKLASNTYSSAGYYSVTMPSPMLNTRLIVLDDIYMMPKYADCKADEKDHAGDQAQSAWLQTELDAAQSAGQRVWVLGHLPPSVNPDSSLSVGAAFCTTGKVVRFQTTDDLANQLTSHADIVKLGIFGHTHMDEFHLLRGHAASVPIKVVASVSPVDGNLPSFTVGTVDRASDTLADYAVYEASNKSGVGASWNKEYAFDEAYQETNFSAPSLSDLIQRLRVDTSGTGNDSRAYQTHFLKGSGGKKLSSSWPGYVCSLDHASAKSFKACVCAAP